MNYYKATAEDYFIGNFFQDQEKREPKKLTKELIEKTYKKCGNMNDAANELKMAIRTLRKYLLMYNIEILKRGGRRY